MGDYFFFKTLVFPKAYFFLSFPLPAHPHKLLQQKQAQEAMKAKAAELQAYQTYLEAEKNPGVSWVM